MRNLSESFERMTCPLGHQLMWRGRWVHVSREVRLFGVIGRVAADTYGRLYDECRTTPAAFPRRYFKR